ncbi:MAG: hypothetical protein RL325_763 [Planctomycetota bacterium]|jgi:AmmeMemoRadiSam system protein B
MTTTELADHLARPALRRVHPVPLQKDNQVFLGLRDPCMLCPQTMVVPPQAFRLMQMFDGNRSIADIAGEVKMPDPQPLVELVRKLDEFGLLWGPTCEALEDRKKQELLAAGAFTNLEPKVLGEDAGAARAQLEKWIDQADDAEIDEPIAGLVTCHLDYPLGYPVYAASYRVIAKAARPDRVVILGTNHFGLGDGVVVSDLGFDTVLGRAPVDRGVIERLRKTADRKLFVDILDHVSEHSIQRQLPWIQHLFGDVPVVAALVPNPLMPMIAEDGARIGTDDFVAMLGSSLAAEGGRTLYIASADLSHVGPAFGMQGQVNEQRRREVEAHDRAMLKEFISGGESVVAKIKETRNPTGWWSVGCMSAVARLAKPSGIELIDYRQNFDESGNGLVSTASLALLA